MVSSGYVMPMSTSSLWTYVSEMGSYEGACEWKLLLCTVMGGGSLVVREVGGNIGTHKFRSRDRREEVVETRDAKVLLGPGDEALEVGLVDGPDGVDVGACKGVCQCVSLSGAGPAYSSICAG